MRAERFGSYSIDGDLRRDAELVAAEVDAPVEPLVAAAAVPRGDAAVGVAAAARCVRPSTSDGSGRLRVTSAKVETLIWRRPGEVGL